MHKELRLLLFLSFLFTTSVPTFAQTEQRTHTTSIRGVVRDAVSHTPLEHIIVTLESASLGYLGQAETDGLGKFNFQGMGQSVFNVSVRHPGYQEMVQRVDLTIATTDYLGFDLQPKHKQTAPAIAPPGGTINARDALVPDKAREEFATAKKLLLEQKLPQKSIEHLRKAIKLYDRYYDARVLLGMAYLEQGKPQDAKSAFEQAITVDPKAPDAHVALGMLASHEKDYPAAEKSLTRALELNPNATEAEYELAKTYWAWGRWQDAEPHAMKVATAHPEFSSVHVLLGNIQLRKRDTNAALREFREYLRLDPGGPMAEPTRAMVNKLEQASAAPAVSH